VSFFDFIVLSIRVVDVTLKNT